MALTTAFDEQQQLAQEGLGHAYFNNGQHEEAALAFGVLYTMSSGRRVKSRAEWYRLLALLPNYKRHQETIKDLLAQITAPENHHNFRTLALDLQRSM